MNDQPSPTVVIFRRWRHTRDLVAVFPEIPASMDYLHECESYEHIGQHGACDTQLIWHKTSPANIADPDVHALLTELKQMGYDPLVIRERITKEMRAKREWNWRAGQQQ